MPQRDMTLVKSPCIGVFTLRMETLFFRLPQEPLANPGALALSFDLS